MKKRVLLIAFVVAILITSLSVLSSCKTNPIEEVTTAESSVASTTGRLYPEIPDGFKYDNETLKILEYNLYSTYNMAGIPNEFVVERENGDIINDEVFKRNQKISQLLGVTIEVVSKTNGEVNSEITKTVTAGDHVYDVVSQCMNSVAIIVNRELVYDFAKFDINLSYPWWDKNAIESFTIADKLFATVSDITTTDKLSTVVTFFNKNMTDDIGIQSDDIYKLVTEGKWTYEKMLEYAATVSLDDGNGTWGKEDTYGISCQDDGSYYLLHSAGLKTVREKADGTLEFAMVGNKEVDALQKIYTLMTDKTFYFNRQTYGLEVSEIATYFGNNRALFMLRPLQTLYELRQVESKFGIIPMPKFAADQDKYYSPVNPYSAVALCLPASIPQGDIEKVSIVLEVMAAESHYNIMPAFYDVVLDVKLVNDPVISSMLDITFGNRIYDIGLIWNLGGLRPTIVTGTPRADSVSSDMKRIESAVNTAMNSLYNLASKNN